MPSPPRVLYKYVGARPHHLQILSALQIRFTQPDDLNDPFDCMPGLTPPVDIAAFVDATMARNAARISANNYSPSQIQAARSRMINEYTNDPDRLVERCFEIVRRNLNELGVLSLAMSNDCMPMWAHYAENYRGFVIGFKTDATPLIKRPGEFASEGELTAVDYTRPRPIVSCDPLLLPPELLFIKGSNWSYEQEWRIVRRLSACDASLPDSAGILRFFLCKIEPSAITRIDIGYNADTATVDAVRTVTASGAPLAHVVVFRARPNAGRTAMVFDPV